MGRRLSDLQKQILRIAAISDGVAYDLQVLGTFDFRDYAGDSDYVVTTLEARSPSRKSPSEARILDHIRLCCVMGDPPFIREHGNTSANKRSTVSRAMDRLERRGLIKRYWRPVFVNDAAKDFLGKSKRGIYELTKKGRQAYEAIDYESEVV